MNNEDFLDEEDIEYEPFLSPQIDAEMMASGKLVVRYEAGERDFTDFMKIIDGSAFHVHDRYLVDINLSVISNPFTSV